MKTGALFNEPYSFWDWKDKLISEEYIRRWKFLMYRQARTVHMTIGIGRGTEIPTLHCQCRVMKNYDVPIWFSGFVLSPIEDSNNVLHSENMTLRLEGTHNGSIFLLYSLDFWILLNATPNVFTINRQWWNLSSVLQICFDSFQFFHMIAYYHQIKCNHFRDWSAEMLSLLKPFLSSKLAEKKTFFR